MTTDIAGSIDGAGLKVAIAAARFNQHIVQGLVEGAVDALVRHGVKEADVAVVRCPGAWELPVLCRRLAAGSWDAVVALGCVIRGETPHFDYVAAECSKGIAQVGLEASVPVIYGVLTCDTVEQAHDRAGLKSGNKGFDAALAALEMVDLLRRL